ncbi:Acetylxylan esterase [Paramyrothecium foliicola]|nr:Acetylxylan esterase [Paramyrothecium foliicola]
MMRSLAVSAAAISALAGGVAAQNSTTTCADGLHIIVARGTGEEGLLGTSEWIAQRVARRVPDTNYVGLNYPASFNDPDYNDSEVQGAEAMKDSVLQYNRDCPDHKLAIVGYSQGAQAASDAFCGGSGGAFSNITAISSDIVESSVVAIVLLGDPSHNPNATYNRGTSENPGIFVRENNTICEGYGDRVVLYCDTGDTWCDMGDDRDVHGHYIEEYGEQIVDYIVNQFEQADDASETTGSPESTPAPTSSGAPEPDSAAPGMAPATGLMLVAGLAMLASML